MQLRTSFLGHSFTKITPNDETVDFSKNPYLPRFLSLGGALTKDFFYFGKNNPASIAGLMQNLNKFNKLNVAYLDATQTPVEIPVQISDIHVTDIVGAFGKSKRIDLIVKAEQGMFMFGNVNEFKPRCGFKCVISFLCEILDSEIQTVSAIKKPNVNNPYFPHPQQNVILNCQGSDIDGTINAFDTQTVFNFAPCESLSGIFVAESSGETVANLDKICFNNYYLGEQTINDGMINYNAYYTLSDSVVFTLINNQSEKNTVVTGEQLLQAKPETEQKEQKLFENRFWTHEHDGKSYMKPK